MACIEDHQFQPNNYWNGRWRSQWCITLPQGSAPAELRGILKVQVNSVEIMCSLVFGWILMLYEWTFTVSICKITK